MIPSGLNNSVKASIKSFVSGTRARTFSPISKAACFARQRLLAGNGGAKEANLCRCPFIDSGLGDVGGRLNDPTPGWPDSQSAVRDSLVAGHYDDQSLSDSPQALGNYLGVMGLTH